MPELPELTPLPLDTLIYSDKGEFSGSGYVYSKAGVELEVKEIKFETFITEVLDPFYYSKPILNPEDPFQTPQEFVLDAKPRVGYYPIALVEQALRPPGHLYEVDDALFTAVNVGTDSEPKWETRYFPKNRLDPKVWNKALEILGI